MPGTILVSVLEFMDLPSSSPSSISIKVSMGRRECQAWDKGDFTFPLTTLRDNLIVVLQDAEGHEISQADIETKSIVEKGVWDDFFPLKGGGFVHMKMQFVLNEEDRNRIRMMRESALRKKHGEFIITSPSSARTNFASSLVLPNEISDRNEETSLPITLHQRVDLPLAESCKVKLFEKIEDQPIHAAATNVPAGAIYADESSMPLRSSQSKFGRVKSLPNLQDDRFHNVEKVPNNVKKMISALESGSAEDLRSLVKPPPTKIRSKTGDPLEVQPFKDKTVNEESAQPISIGLVKPAHLHQEVDTKKDKFLKDVTRTSNVVETVKVSEKIVGKHRSQTSKMLHGKRKSGGNDLVIEESLLIEVSSMSSKTIDIEGGSANLCAPAANCEDRHMSFESSGAWIFPDEAMRFCVTTSGKKAMNLLGGCSKKPSFVQGRVNNVTQQQNVQEQNADKLEVENSEEAGISGGPIGKAIKVLIMIGFGTLVLLTRQRRNR